MLFNLVGPLLARNDLMPLENVLIKKGITWPDGDVDAILEFEDREVFYETRGQPTSIDLMIFPHASSSSICVEAKFVEREFGGCSVYQGGDCDGQNPSNNLDLCYLHHIRRRYWVLLQKYGISNGKLGTDTMCILASHYQFFRELLFSLEKAGSFILLSDERSPVFYCRGSAGVRGLMPLLVDLLPLELQAKVAAVTIQELVAAIRETGRHRWIDEFALKYGLPVS